MLVMEVVVGGDGVGGSAFSEQAALMMLGSKVWRITGVVTVRKTVALSEVVPLLLPAVP